MSDVVDDYGWDTGESPESCGYISPTILSILRELNSRRVLDIGSGNGRLCYEMAHGGYDVVGCEYDQSGVTLSKKQYPNIPFYNYGVQDDPGELLSTEDRFDTVVSTEVVEHLFAPHLLPVYAGQVLKSGGWLILSTPYHGYIKNVLISMLGKWDKHHTPLWHGGHIKFWSRRTLTSLLENNGFEYVNFLGVGRLPYLWKSMIIVAKKI